MIGRHILAMTVMVVGLVVGVVLAVDDSWKTGLVVGVIIVAIGFLFALGNMFNAFRRSGLNRF